MTAEEEDIEASLIYFAEAILSLNLYWWQTDAIRWYDALSAEMILGSIATPNGSGKSSVVIPVLVLGLLFFYPRAKIVLTTADGKQLDGQVMPAINQHRGKFPTWRFVEREVTTPTGGRFVAFTTDEPGRAEGWHKYSDEEGPLLIIVDEAKSVPENIFQAIDRCTYNGLLLTSSPGKMSGKFYESQFKAKMGFNTLQVGLKDCPHITQDKIDRIIAQYGPNSPFTRSTLHGEFLDTYEGDPVYYAYSMQAHERRGLPWMNGATLVVGMDGATHNASIIMSTKQDKNGNTHVWIHREIVLLGSDTDRQAIKLLEVLAEEFPFWNSNSSVCPQTLFFCDPALRNSNYTKAHTAYSSALKVLHSHNIYPGFKIALGLQPSIAAVNRLMQGHHMVEITNFESGEKTQKPVWHFQINPDGCPVLCDALRGRYRYPKQTEPGYGLDKPLKGELVQYCDDAADAARYAINGILTIAEELHAHGMKANIPERKNIEPKRTI